MSEIVENAAEESPNAHARAKSELETYAGRLTGVSVQVADSLSARAQSIGAPIRDEFVSISAAAAEVTDLLRAGRLTTAEARRRLQVLDGRRRVQSQRRDSFDAMSARVEEIDADPLAAGIAMAETNVGLQWELS